METMDVWTEVITITSYNTEEPDYTAIFLHSSILLYSVWIHFYCGVFSTEFAHTHKKKY